MGSRRYQSPRSVPDGSELNPHPLYRPLGEDAPHVRRPTDEEFRKGTGDPFFKEYEKFIKKGI